MKRNTFLVLLLTGILFFALSTSAQEVSNHKLVWTKKQNARTGLYNTRNYFVSHGVSLSFYAMYYFGDVDNVGVAFNGGFNKNNLSYGGAFSFQYKLPVSQHCNMRFSLMGGTLRGNNREKFERIERKDYRKFNSIFLQPAVGVEVYPIHNAGFYLYGGLALTMSYITNYEFYHYVRATQTYEPVSGKTYGFLPMVQFGLGYTFRLTDSWTLGIEAMLQEGIVDTHYMNLDAWPLASGQNSEGIELGSRVTGSGHNKWNDGWFQFGLTVTYRWRNCEKCRIQGRY